MLGSMVRSVWFLVVGLVLGGGAGCDDVLGLERGGSGPEGDNLDVDGGVETDVPAGIQCPSSYISSGTSRYRIIDSVTGWEQASSNCVADGELGGSFTHLAVWADDTERLAVTATTNGSYWIGLSDLRTPGVFRWNTGEVGNVSASSAWTVGQPLGSGCTSTQDDDTWTIAPCEEPRGYICECDTHPNDTTQYR